MKLVPAESASTIASLSLSKRPVSCELPVSDKITNAEALWTFKVAASDFSLRSCDNLSDLFGKKMFANSNTAQGFNLECSKISYVLSDGFTPLLLKQICDKVRKSNSGFTLMFDDTTNAKVEKQMDILIRYWSEKGEVQTKYLTSFIFGATAEVITDFLLSLMHDKDINLPWEKFFNISSDGPNINKKNMAII